MSSSSQVAIIKGCSHLDVVRTEAVNEFTHQGDDYELSGQEEREELGVEHPGHPEAAAAEKPQTGGDHASPSVITAI